MVKTDDPAAILPYGRQWIDEDDIEAVVAVLRGDWLTQGPAVAEFERRLAERCGARYAVAVSSGTAALHLACLAAGVAPGDFGITSPITFVASANCIAYCGGEPGFADVDEATVTMAPESLEAVCSRRAPRVVIPVHFAGQPADIEAIRAIAGRHGAAVIEDACHALGARYTAAGREYPIGSCAHSDMAIFSFHPVKHVTTGEGGAIVTNSDRLKERLEGLRSHGITRDPRRLGRREGPWYSEQQELGYNYRITDLQCALGASQLSKLESFVERRRLLVDRYAALTADLAPEVRLLLEHPGRRSSYHLLVARLSGGAARRARVFDELVRRGIRPQVHYVPVHLQPWYRERLASKPGDYPRAEAYYSGCLSLPLFPRMSETDVDRVVGSLREALASTGGLPEPSPGGRP